MNNSDIISDNEEEALVNELKLELVRSKNYIENWRDRTIKQVKGRQIVIK